MSLIRISMLVRIATVLTVISCAQFGHTQQPFQPLSPGPPPFAVQPNVPDGPYGQSFQRQISEPASRVGFPAIGRTESLSSKRLPVENAPGYHRTNPPAIGNNPSTAWPSTAPNAPPNFGNRALPNFTPNQHIPPATPNLGDLFEPAQIVGTVGEETILAGDLLGDINQYFEKNNIQLSEDELVRQRRFLMKKLINGVIDTRLIYNDFLRNTPSEHLEEIRGKIDREFDESQLDRVLKKYNAADSAELDANLRNYGSSLEKLRQAFARQVLAREMIRRNTQSDREVTHQEMLDRYREHLDEYEVPGKAEWEELTVEFQNYRSREAALRDIANMGNQVLRGAPLAAVARRSQQGPRARFGGLHEWTTQGSLRSQPLDRALFTLPVGELSQFIEDEDGIHIIRVTHRADAHRIPFERAQVKIKERIQEDNRKKQMASYLARLKEETPVWTLFDREPDETQKEQVGNSQESRYSRLR